MGEVKNFVAQALDAGGTISPLIVPSQYTNGTGTFNPSVYNDGGKLYCNIRHCQVTIYHSELNKFEHQWGPLSYLNPENDVTLRTTNFFCELNDDLTIKESYPIRFMNLEEPKWEFIGLEDCRVFRWDDKLYICGVRRDTTTNGVGRMELCEVQITPTNDRDWVVKEVSRFRIPAPGKDDSYCEKNWMPILDMPYHFVKWCNPTEVVKVDPEKKTCETVHLGNYVPQPLDFRGGSQVLTMGNYRIAITHQTNLFSSDTGKKNAVYRHNFVVWDLDWNVVMYSAPFSFLETHIEFCTGMALQGTDLLISFGIQDNAAYILKVPMKFIAEFLNATLN